jgi:hypothetical protein
LSGLEPTGRRCCCCCCCCCWRAGRRTKGKAAGDAGPAESCGRPQVMGRELPARALTGPPKAGRPMRAALVAVVDLRANMSDGEIKGALGRVCDGGVMDVGSATDEPSPAPPCPRDLRAALTSRSRALTLVACPPIRFQKLPNTRSQIVCFQDHARITPQPSRFPDRSAPLAAARRPPPSALSNRSGPAPRRRPA